MKPRTDTPGVLDTALGQFVQAALRQEDVSGAIVVLVANGRVFTMPYGVCSYTGGRAVDADTAFDLGSCSKAFTATAAALLVDRGLLDWDEPLHRLVPEFRLYDDWVSEHVTLRDALGNRLGIQRELPLEASMNPDLALAEILSLARHARELNPFRDRFSYLNLGFMAATVAVERASGRPFGAFMAEELFTPLGMTSTTLGPPPEREANRAIAQASFDGRVRDIHEPFWANYQGACGIHSTGRDLARWLSFNLGGDAALLPGGLGELHRPQVRIDPRDVALWQSPPGALFPSYGLGWAVSQLHGRRIVQHMGEGSGMRAHIALLPDDGVGAAILIATPTRVAPAIAYHLLEHALGHEPADWVAEVRLAAERREARWAAAGLSGPAAATGVPSDRIGGRYESPSAGAIVIAREADGFTLEFERSSFWAQRLVEVAQGVFDAHYVLDAARAYSAVPTRVSFHGAPDGSLTLEHSSFGTARRVASPSPHST